MYYVEFCISNTSWITFHDIQFDCVQPATSNRWNFSNKIKQVKCVWPVWLFIASDVTQSEEVHRNINSSCTTISYWLFKTSTCECVLGIAGHEVICQWFLLITVSLVSDQFMIKTKPQTTPT